MADSAWAPNPAYAFRANSEVPRHAGLVRATHWTTALCVFALLLSGFELVISHPRFYWGETGNVTTPALFKIPIPASRATVPTGYDYVLHDQNGWSRALHFQAAWALILAGFVYAVFGTAGHFRKNLLPRKGDLSWRALWTIVAGHLRFHLPESAPEWSYNPLQRLTYLLVIFVLSPLEIWTGLAMSPAFVAAVPATVVLLGGQQSARTIHFFVSLSLLAFLVVHVAMVCRAGFTNRMRAMITGRVAHSENI